MRDTVRSICTCLLIGSSSSLCWADGGAVRAVERDGPLEIAIFTSPNPLVAGTVDVSVLVQDAFAHAPIDEARVEVALAPRGRTVGAVTLQATSEAATNKLFRACLVELEAGWYDVEVRCDAPDHLGTVRFGLEVGAAPPRLAVLWPWFTWPVVPVALFGLHLLLSRKRSN